MNKNRQGFTLIELLIVIAILSTLAAIIFPVFASVRRDARRAVSTSNLKQCGMALLMYCDDYNGPEDMPVGEVAASLVLKKMPTCDPSDTWRTSCAEDYGKPLIGSYAYINNFGPQYPEYGDATVQNWHDHWLFHLQIYSNPALLSSIFYADPVPVPFHGITRGPSNPSSFAGCGTHLSGCLVPNQLLEFRLDGSVKMVKSYYPYTQEVAFEWTEAFPDDT